MLEHRLVAPCLVGTLAVAFLAVGLPGATAGLPDSSMRPGHLALEPTDDSYVSPATPDRPLGALDRIVVTTVRGAHQDAFLKFTVPALPAGTRVEHASLQASVERGKERVEVRSVAADGWAEKTLTYRNAPPVGDVVGRPLPNVAGRVNVDLSTLVTGAGTYSFAVRSPLATTTMTSKEARGWAGPRLYLRLSKVTPPPPPPPPPVAETMFGTTIYHPAGQSFGDALTRQTRLYGTLDIVRAFYQGMPEPWPGNAGLSGGPVVVSFKAPPAQILDGRYDAFFRDWFAKAPRDRPIFWTNFHEPEDQIETGVFTAQQYRDSFRRLAGLAREAGNPRLKATTVWMCSDLTKGSGRDWHDYWPGSDVVDVMGWDCYNRGRVTGAYDSPEELLGALVAAAAEVGRPWGLGEYGSKLARGDSGTARAAWLLASADYARRQGALFVTYFDAYGGAADSPEYRLLDEPSRAAWRDIVQS